MERNKVDEKYKWKLEDLYCSIDEYNKDIEVLGKLVEEFITYEGKVTIDDKTLLHALLLQEKIDSQRVKLNDLILNGLGKDDLLELSRKLDDLINE